MGRIITRRANRVHAERRALERFNVALTSKLRRELLGMIRNGNVWDSKPMSKTRTLVILEHDGKAIPVIYSKIAKDIITVLPSDAHELAEMRAKA